MQQFVVAVALATFNAKSTSCSIYVEQVNGTDMKTIEIAVEPYSIQWR